MLDVPGVCPINLVVAGPAEGAPVVFLHAVGLDLTWWGEQFARFVGERRVVAFDMPGHGASGSPDQAVSFDLMADVVEAVVNAMGGRPAHLVGLSVGGMIAQAFALRRPDLVRSLCLTGTLCTFPDEVRKALSERARVARTEGMARIAELSNERWFPAAFRARRPDMLDRASKMLQRQSGDFHGSMWDMIARLDFEARLPEIRCPALVITGGEDINAPVAAAQKIAGLIAGARLEIMPGVGHFAPYEAPTAFDTLLADFLAAVET